MSDQPTAQTPIFSWLVTSCFDSRIVVEAGPTTFAKLGGVIRLQPMTPSATTEDIRYWSIDPIEEGQATEKAKQLSLEMAREAESDCEGRGGGKRRYVLRACMNGERRVIATFTFGVELEPDGQADQLGADTSPKAIIQMFMDSQREKDRIIAQQAKTMQDASTSHVRVIQEQAKAMEMLPKMMVEVFQAMQVVSQNQIGNEAQAFATAQRSKDMSEFISDIKPLFPMAIQWLMEKKTSLGDGSDSTPPNGHSG